MIIINDVINVKEKTSEDNSYYNYELDSSSEYCQNTSSWD